MPAYRGRGAAKALLYEALNRARALGAKRAYVISDQVFYEKLGFRKDRTFSFYWKK
ncbi:MAG: GNAT family N-acetyltransferase [Oscillospiraceae bacterium]|nr:GNAT family N-acetyltransferase [Oscillospiraceae bacterium]